MQTPLWNLSPLVSVLLIGMAVAALPLLALLRAGRVGRHRFCGLRVDADHFVFDL